MVRKRMGLLEGYPSRRDILRGMAGLLLAVSLESCAQGLSSASSSNQLQSLPLVVQEAYCIPIADMLIVY